MSNKNLTLGVLVAIVIAIGAYFFPQAQQLLQGVTNYDSLGVTSLILGCNTTYGTGCTGSAPTSAVTEQVSVGSCASATSTLFALANPFTATSSVTLFSMIGTGQATTSSLLVGTSTASTGITSTTVTPSLVSSTNGLATTTSYIVKSGYNTGASLGSGQIAAGSNAFATIVVGPSEFVVGYSTSTATGAGAANYTAGQTCTYKFRWAI